LIEPAHPNGPALRTVDDHATTHTTVRPPPTIHRIKILPQWFMEVQHMGKRAEVRRDDRDYKERDVLHLMEWTPERGFTGQVLEARIRHVLRDAPGIEAGYCVITIGNPRRVRHVA
jgi:hypothetical protein